MKMYHVAPVRARDSIRKYGINPTLADERWSSGERPYAFADLAEAEWYCSYNNSLPPVDDPAEIWELEVEHPGDPDLGLSSSDEPTSAYQLQGPVPPSATILLV